MSTGKFPDILSQQVLAGIIFSRGIGRTAVLRTSTDHRPPERDPKSGIWKTGNAQVT